MPDYLFCLESKKEPSSGNDTKLFFFLFFWGGEDVLYCTCFLDVRNNWGEEKTYTEWGDTAQTLLMGGTITVGIPHNIERT